MTIDPASIRESALRIFDRVEAACLRSGRDPKSVQVVGVSKKQPPEVWGTWSEICSQLDRPCIIGENYVQEFITKRPSLPAGCETHFTGTLQSNKVASALEIFDLIETVHSEKVLRKIDAAAARAGKRQRILLEVNVSRDPAKSGFLPEEIEQIVDQGVLASASNIDCCGLMTITALHPSPEGARGDFLTLRRISERFQSILGPEMSMGMSNDFEVAIEAGATLVRIGTALFGERVATKSREG